MTKEEVLAVIKHIKVMNPWCLTRCIFKTLWEARGELAVALAEIFASTLVTGEDLEDWMVVNIVPLFKGSKGKPGNYRSVSK